MVRLLSKAFFLALVVVLLYITFAALFDSLPQSPQQGDSIDIARNDDALKGAVGQVPAEAQVPVHTRHVAVAVAVTTAASEPTPTPESDKKEHVSKTEEEAEKEKVRAEEFNKKEEEKKKLFDATKISKNVAFSVPADIKYDPEGPRPDQIVLLCASDGKGHNGGIENLLEQTRENRQAYANFHGYKYHFLNISKFDITPAHPVWGKLPAIAETFETYPEAQWIWWLDLDAILMTPSLDLNEHLLSHRALDKQLLKGQVLNNSGGGKSKISTLKNPNVKNIDLIFSQDHNGINAGSFFIRRSEWTRTFLDIWADPLFVMRIWPGQEQDAVSHLVLKHHTVMEHLGLVGQRALNAYPIGTKNMGWEKGDLVVHLAGCWVEDECNERWEQYMALREPMPKREHKGVRPTDS